MAKKTRHLSPKQRINLVMEFYHKRGTNKERVNSVYIKIINLKIQQ